MVSHPALLPYGHDSVSANDNKKYNASATNMTNGMTGHVESANCGITLVTYRSHSRRL